MNKKILSFLLGFLFVFLIGIAYIGYNYYNQEKILKEEIHTLSHKDLFKDNYKIQIKTINNYSEVESSIKKYYRELANNAKMIEENLTDKEISNIMTIDNFKNDGTKFVKSQKLLKDAIEKNDRAMNNINTLCSKETIKSYYTSKTNNRYYLNLYKELLYNDNRIKALQETRDEIKIVHDDLDSFYQKEKEILTYLANNDRHWEIKNDELLFGVSDLAEKYNKMYKELLEITKKFNNQDRKNLPSISSL